MYQSKETKKNLILYLVDMVCILSAYFLANGLWLGLYKGFMFLNRAELTNDIGITLFSFVVIIFLFNNNRDFLKRKTSEELLYVLKINLFFAAAFAISLFVRGNANRASRGVFVLTPVINIILMFISHSFVKYFFTQIYSKMKRNVQIFVITTEERAEASLKNLSARTEWVDKVHGIAVVDKSIIGEEIKDVPVVADKKTMFEYVKNEFIDEVFIDVPYTKDETLRNAIMEFENMGVVVHLNIEMLAELSDFKQTLNMIGDVPVITFANNNYDANKLFIKRILDIIGALVGILLTFIISIFVAPAILIESRGPLIFKQKRVGKNGRYFYLYKFRSMYRDAEQQKKALMKQNEVKGHMFKMKDDPRITKVGKFIRKTNLDEFPQFFNVLKGDMSLVGTRPPTVDEFLQYEGYHKRRLSMKPGITGMWQTSGRSEIKDFEEVVKLDLQYIDNWSIGLDIKILFKTVGQLFTHKGV